MEHVKNLVGTMSKRLREAAAANVVTAKPLSVGDRHIMPLCELALSFGGGGGGGEGEAPDGPKGVGRGGLAGGGTKVNPIAVVVVDGGEVRLEKIGR